MKPKHSDFHLPDLNNLSTDQSNRQANNNSMLVEELPDPVSRNNNVVQSMDQRILNNNKMIHGIYGKASYGKRKRSESKHSDDRLYACSMAERRCEALDRVAQSKAASSKSQPLLPKLFIKSDSKLIPLSQVIELNS